MLFNLPTIIKSGQEAGEALAPLKQIILGVDPGSRRTGFGLIAVEGDRVEHIDHGVIQLNENAPLPERLCVLQKALNELYAKFTVHTTVIEKVFFGKNAASAFVLGHARGVCLLASAQHNTVLAEYAARYVKKCVTGSGAATKDHVQLVVFSLLRVPNHAVAFDASDALSLALTHARVRETSVRMKKALESSL